MSTQYKGTLSMLAVAVSLALTGCLGGGGGGGGSVQPPEPPTKNPETVAFESIMNTALDDQSAVDPYGFGIDDASVARKRAVDEGLLDKLQKIDRSKLSEQDQLFYDMMKWDLGVNIEGYKLPLNVVPIHHFRNYVVDRAGNVGGVAPAVSKMLAASVGGSSAEEVPLSIHDYYGGTTVDRLKVGGRNDVDCGEHDHAGPAAMRVAAATDPLAWYQERLKWIKAYNKYMDDVLDGFSYGNHHGMVLPQRLVDRMLAQFQGKLGSDGNLKNYKGGYADLSSKVTGEDAFKADYLASVEASNTKFKRLLTFLQGTDVTGNDGKPIGGYKARPDGGVNGDGYAGMDDPATKGVHEGMEMYKWYLKKNTTATMTPDEVFADGQKMVERIYGEMKKVCTTVGKCGVAPSDAEMKAFLQGYLNEPQFRFGDLNKTALWSKTKNPDTIEIAAFNQYGQNAAFSAETWQKVQAEIDGKGDLSADEKAALKKHYQALYEYYQFKPHMAAEIDNYFLKESQAKADYGIRPVTWEDSPYDGVAYYTGNNFYLNTYSPYMINSWSLSTLLAHEAAPGHHFQVALADELKPTLPKYAAKAHYTAYVEGWALYTEALAEEMGMYSGKGLNKVEGDPKVEGSAAFKNQLEYFGRLNEEQMRAMRRVVDTGIHWKGWTHDQAVAYMKANSALGDGDISSEVPRYMAYVGQATSYKAGQVSIERSRQKAKDALGSGFDVKKFHREVLNTGALPLSVLEAKIANWVKAGGK